MEADDSDENYSPEINVEDDENGEVEAVPSFSLAASKAPAAVIDDGAAKLPDLEDAAGVKLQEPQQKTSALWSFFLQGKGKPNKLAECMAIGFKKPLVKAQSTSNWSQHMDRHHKDRPAYAALSQNTACRSIAVPNEQNKSTVSGIFCRES